MASPGMGQSALVLRIAVRLETASSAGPIHDVQFISAMSSLEPEIGSWSSSLAAQRLKRMTHNAEWASGSNRSETSCGHTPRRSCTTYWCFSTAGHLSSTENSYSAG